MKLTIAGIAFILLLFACKKTFFLEQVFSFAAIAS